MSSGEGIVNPTINFTEFVRAVENCLGINISSDSNEYQYSILVTPSHSHKHIIAGPGSGKTTMITIFTLKILLVEGESPKSILITTFTRKAAEELRSRIQGWGTQIIEYCSTNFQVNLSLDFSKLRIGTLDSLIEELFAEFTTRTRPIPSIIEDHGSRILLTRIFLERGLHAPHRRSLISYFQILGYSPRLNVRRRIEILKDLADRFIQNLVNITDFMNYNHQQRGREQVIGVINSYWRDLRERYIADFGTQELLFLLHLLFHNQISLVDEVPESLIQSVFGFDHTSEDLFLADLEPFLDDLKFIFIDEYQDTNFLQEKIYFELLRATEANNGSILVVGDDDQSIYRFRGATVDLFVEFHDRLNNSLSLEAETFPLTINYRSSNNIINFINNFISLSHRYQETRSEEKPEIEPPPNENHVSDTVGPPIIFLLGTREEIAKAISNIAMQIYGPSSHPFIINFNNRQIEIRAQEGGTYSDIAFIKASAREIRGNTQRLPFYLRIQCERHGIRVYNPRGRLLRQIIQAQQFLGVILLAIDQNSQLINQLPLERESLAQFHAWRQEGQRYCDQDNEVQEYVNAFFNRQKFQNGQVQTESWPITGKFNHKKLLYDLLTWFEFFQDDVEGVAYFEAIMSAVDQASLVGSYQGNFRWNEDDPNLWLRSRIAFIRNVLEPIALGIINVNEDLLETLPDNLLPVLTIHQAKGLEFPIVVVDAGSDFNQNNIFQRRFRFPEDDSRTLSSECIIEDDLRHFSDLALPSRSPIERSHDDLVRKYYVAYSRTMDLLIVCLTNNAWTRPSIPSIQTGWILNGHNRGLSRREDLLSEIDYVILPATNIIENDHFQDS